VVRGILGARARSGKKRNPGKTSLTSVVAWVSWRRRRGVRGADRGGLSALRSPLSALRSPLSALRSPLSALRSPLSALRSPLSAGRERPVRGLGAGDDLHGPRGADSTPSTDGPPSGARTHGRPPGTRTLRTPPRTRDHSMPRPVPAARRRGCAMARARDGVAARWSGRAMVRLHNDVRHLAGRKRSVRAIWRCGGSRARAADGGGGGVPSPPAGVRAPNRGRSGHLAETV
jgi:hypothetical protein